MEKEESKSIDDVNEFLRTLLTGPDKVCLAFEETHRRLDALEVSRKQDEQDKEHCIQSLIQAAADVKYIESQLRDQAYQIEREESQRKKDEAEQQRGLSLAEKNTRMSKVWEEVECERRLLDERQSKIDALLKEELTALRANYRLYRYLTGVEWNLAQDPAKMCEGYVAAEDDTRPFSLDRTESSPAFIANYLWGLMDDESKEL